MTFSFAFPRTICSARLPSGAQMRMAGDAEVEAAIRKAFPDATRKQRALLIDLRGRAPKNCVRKAARDPCLQCRR